MPVNNTIQFRKGVEALWISSNPVLSSGEPGFDTTNKILKIGDGSTPWLSLAGAGEIEEYTTTINLPSSGNTNILYRTTDDGRLYQWTGSFYAEIGPDSLTTGSHAGQHYTNGSDPILNVVSRPNILTTNVNNYAHNNADILYLDSSANRIITGLAAAADGAVKLLINKSLYTITLDNQDSSSDPSNRFLVPFGSDYVLQPGYSITIVYDADALRWRILA